MVECMPSYQKCLRSGELMGSHAKTGVLKNFQKTGSLKHMFDLKYRAPYKMFVNF